MLDPEAVLGEFETFRDRPLPEPARLAGYAALMAVYDLNVPIPLTLSATRSRADTKRRDDWILFGKSYEPVPSLGGHLVFALRYEGVDLAVLNALFRATGRDVIAALIQETPTGRYARRIWFLYEWLMREPLDLPDAGNGNYVPVVDVRLQFAAKGTRSSRHRILNNLPGTAAFCPMIRRTPIIDHFIRANLADMAQESIAQVPKDIVARAASFLLLKDTKATYRIEGETPDRPRQQKWGAAVSQAGRHPVSVAELDRLQRIVIGDRRFVRLGLRTEGGFVGEHDRETGAPIPDHVSARPDDLQDLMSGLLAFDEGPAAELDPVLAAAVLAFGFVYIHPYEDGNGRLHRYLIHHVLARRGFNPPELVFPVSAAILKQIGDYRRVLESYSQRMLPLVVWETTAGNNVHVLNETVDLYRYFDATPHAEFLFSCVESTILRDLPEETDFLRRHDAAKQGIMSRVEMPDRMAENLIMFIRQNNGRLSDRRRKGAPYDKMTEDEVSDVEDIVCDAFDIVRRS